ncbi:hypothetical protein [Intrasporangium sp.]|uniref:hypothetical protein n=1 Tax=Intrasporangium sp. TaxID=1925024 RepID=UPI0032219ECB
MTAAPVAAAAPTATPVQVAQMARAKITLPKPTIGSAPCSAANCMGAVGVPVWLWTDPANWRPITASASVAGITVNVQARMSSVAWSMGDGHTVTCATPGTKFDLSWGFRDSPDCGYRYQKTSRNQPDGRYTLRATATYDVVFSGAYTGTLNPTTSSTTSLAIGEYQVIIER